MNLKKFIAEFIGTMVLIVFGCGSAVVSQCAPGAAGHLMTALVFGLVIVAMAYSVGNVSGCHINPAVSMGMLVAGKMTVKEFFGYVIAQFCGAVCGAAVLKLVLSVSSTFASAGLGTNSLYEGNVVASLVIEAILTFVFVFAILGVTSRESNGSVAGIVIGLTLVLVHIMGIPFTGTSVNPARSFGPALLAGGDALKCVWVFIVAPLAGGAMAAVIHRLLNKTE